MSRLAAIGVLLALLVAPGAQADCISPATCICQPSEATAVADGHVSAVSGPNATMTVEALTGVAPGVALGNGLTLRLGDISQAKVGDRILAVLVQREWIGEAIVDASGGIPCKYVPAAKLTTEQVTQFVMRQNCGSDFEALINSQGIKPAPCDDTPFGCQQGGVSALTVLTALLVLRRRTAGIPGT